MFQELQRIVKDGIHIIQSERYPTIIERDQNIADLRFEKENIFLPSITYFLSMVSNFPRSEDHHQTKSQAEHHNET